ncbi:MAG: chorismate mutase [Candidatus Acidiferrales bacterium]
MAKRSEGMAEIRELRRRIDLIDTALLRMISRRARLAIEVGYVKRRTGLAAKSSVREREILRRIAQENGGPLDDAAVRRIFHEIVRESRRTAIREIS